MKVQLAQVQKEKKEKKAKVLGDVTRSRLVVGSSHFRFLVTWTFDDSTHTLFCSETHFANVAKSNVMMKMLCSNGTVAVVAT